ncbi:AAA family ATPase [Bythopirellula goksoeyrii]|uniref:ATP-dependent zinc metalloprotease FtsH 4 n=1 Tax=Bythopirellula goksoeyrii TaxID=1400387 RepID=A0A5B9QE98_9BACT|nr:ATP-binding protein [Bythopirellula goksoeyrii]QEG35822.1 ATP-dependent zinc metalloprotease FtsH 4 [Bythopirellula goksoeyrii]
MNNHSTDGIFDEVTEFPDPETKRRLERLVGLDEVKERLVKEAMMQLQPSSLEEWSLRHFDHLLPALCFFQRRPPLFILAGDVGTGKTELAETFGDAVSRKAGIPILLHSLSLTARGTGAVGEMTRLISAAFAMIKSQAACLTDRQAATTGHILLIDEADALAQSRESAQMHHEDRAGVNALIRGIDDLAEGRRPVLVVMCTNRLRALDPAVMRRAAATFEFSRPNAEQRRVVLRNAFPEYVCSESELTRIVELTGNRDVGAGFSFSDITQRLVPSVVLAAYPNQGINAELIASVALTIKPTPTFTEV